MDFEARKHSPNEVRHGNTAHGTEGRMEIVVEEIERSFVAAASGSPSLRAADKTSSGPLKPTLRSKGGGGRNARELSSVLGDDGFRPTSVDTAAAREGNQAQNRKSVF